MDEAAGRVGYVLKQVQQALRAAMDDALRRHGLTTPQYAALSALAEAGALSGAALARRGFVTPQTMNGIVANLEAAGLVVRRADPADRRIWRLHLCPPSRPILNEMCRERADIYGLATAGLDKDEVQAVTDALCRIKLNVVAELRAKPAEKELA